MITKYAAGVFALLVGASAAPGWGATYYVASGVPTALDAVVPAAGIDAPGHGSISLPFRTIQYATRQVSPGDTVIVRNGDYDEQVCLGYDMLDTPTHTRSGTSASWITFRAENLHRAFVHPDSTVNGVTYGASFVLKSVVSSMQEQIDTWSATTNPVSYIQIEGFDLQDAGQVASGVTLVLAHHIVVSNNVIHDNGAAGVAALSSDYLTIQDNQIFNNCRTSMYNGSGVSVLWINPLDHQTLPYHNLIQRNSVYNNYIAAGAKDVNNQVFAHTDGNGIIVDTSPYNVSTLIQNNVIYANGGRGIQLCGDTNVDVFNNTCYHNNTDPEVGAHGEITTQQVTWAGGGAGDPLNAPPINLRIRSNICCPSDGKQGLSLQNSSTNCMIQNNWLYSANDSPTIEYTNRGVSSAFPTNPEFPGCTIDDNYGAPTSGWKGVASDPLFVSPGVDTSASVSADFQLRTGSLCRGESWSEPTDDHDGYPRHFFDNQPYDLGAYQFHADSGIACGGAASAQFSADQSYHGGATAYYAANIIKTTGVTRPAPQSVYQGQRYGNFSYTLSGLIPGQPYTVRLHFAETYWTAANKRVFGVQINGEKVLSNFDIFAKVGGNQADVEGFTATASAAGQIVIAFSSVKDNAMVSGIELLPNVFGAGAISSGGSVSLPFVADNDFNGGRAASTTRAVNCTGVVNAAPMSVYQHERYGNLEYIVPGCIPGNSYTVRLHFAAIDGIVDQTRSFDVLINGVRVLWDFNIYAKVGEYRADVQSFTTTANTEGQITIDFVSVTNQAKVSGIEIIPIAGQ